MDRAKSRQLLSERFVRLLVKAQALVKNELVTSFVPEEVTGRFVDLDRLWNKGEFFAELVDLVEAAFLQWALEERFSYQVIAAASSVLAAYGSVPIASALACRLKKDLCIFAQTSTGQYGLYPSTLPSDVLLGGRGIVLLQDAIVHGRSVGRVAELIRSRGGKLQCVVTLVDQRPEGRQLPQVLEKLPIFVLASRDRLENVELEESP